MDNNIIENCTISDSANIGKMITLINTKLGESCMVGNFSKMTYSKMDTLSYIGDYSVVINSNIGKFCSISWGVTIGPEEHDFNRVTSHSFLYSTKSFKLVKEKMYSPFLRECSIGNDVWVGCNSTILRGVTIGDGAVIGANSLVNKDVPPYAVVVGNPGRVIKFRFNNDVIDALMNLQWWNFSVRFISENSELFSLYPTITIVKEIEKVYMNSLSKDED